MNKEELDEVKEFHYEKIKRLCQRYVNNELDYRTGIGGDKRLIEINKVIASLSSEIIRINKISNLIRELDNKEEKGNKYE